MQPLQAGNFKLPIKCSSIVFNLENLFRFHCLINVFLKKFFKNMKKIRNRILDLIHTVLTCGGRGKMSGRHENDSRASFGHENDSRASVEPENDSRASVGPENDSRASDGPENDSRASVECGGRGKMSGH